MRGAWRSGGRWRALERKLARSGRNAGGRRRCVVGMVPRRARASQRLGGLSQFTPAWPWASFEIELGHTEQWAGSVRCIVLFQLFKNYPNLVIQVCCLPEFQKCPKFASC
jgi:hypothetical protein